MALAASNWKKYEKENLSPFSVGIFGFIHDGLPERRETDGKT